MQYLNNALNDGYLCKSNTDIGMILTDIFTSTFTDAEYDKFQQMKVHIKRCIICAKYTGSNHFTICNYCMDKYGYNVNFKLTLEKLNGVTTAHLSCDAEELFHSIFPDRLELVFRILKDLRRSRSWELNTLSMRLNGLTCSIRRAEYVIIYENIEFTFDYDMIDGWRVFKLLCANVINVELDLVKNILKLHDDYYKNATILFIMNYNDNKSTIHMLNRDIIVYILQFIY